jgi:hypothetical protein
MLNGFIKTLPPPLKPNFELGLGHGVQDVALFQPAGGVIDAVPHEIKLLGTSVLWASV